MRLAKRLSPTQPAAPGETSRLDGVDLVRALAALSIVVFHAIPYFFPSPEGSLQHQVLIYTRLGVPMLFAVSGFAMTHALLRSRYHPRQLGWLLLQRGVRLHLPYAGYMVFWVALFAVGTRLMSPDQPAFQTSWPEFLSNLTWTAGLTGQPWYQYHFYALPLVFEFYVVLGLAFPWLTSPSGRTAWSLICLLALVAFPESGRTWLPMYLPAFLVGVTAYRLRVIRDGSPAWVQGLVFVHLLVVMGVTWGPERATGAAVAGVILTRGCREGRWIATLATFSYSLFLVHPLVIHLSAFQGRALLGSSRTATLALFALSLVGAIAFAWGFHRLVEAPSHRLASRLKRKRSPTPPSGTPQGDG